MNNNKLKIVDLRSDMVSIPEDFIKESLSSIDLGVDLFGECQITRELENYAADLFQKESALFFPSGVMANLCAVMAHVPKGQEVIVGKSSHIFSHEGGGVSVLGGIPIKTIDDDEGILNEVELKSRIGDGSFFSTKTGLICIENPHNDAAGIAHKPEEYEGIFTIAQSHKIPVHLDGARIFNACAKYGVEPADYARQVDSLMFCLNKGLRAPAGALLLGSRSFVDAAKSLRKLVGGGLCQPGLLSAIGNSVLRRGWNDLKVDNDNASNFVAQLEEQNKFVIKPIKKTTNIVYVYLKNLETPAYEYVPEFESLGIKLLANDVAFRVVFHSKMTEADVHDVAQAFCKIIK